MIGVCLTKKEFDKGTDKLRRVIENYPKYSNAYFWLATQYKSNQLNEEAEKIFDEGIANADDKEVMKNDKASFLYDIGRIKDSLTLIDEILAEFKNNLSAYLLKAKIHTKSNEKEIAHSTYLQAYKINPQSENVLKNFAKFLYDDGKKAESLLMYKKLIIHFPENYEFWGLLGNNYLYLKFYNKALNCYEKADELSEGKKEWIAANIGNLYYNTGLFDKAKPHLEKAIEFDSDSEYSHKRLSEIIKNKEEEEKKENEIIERVKQKMA